MAAKIANVMARVESHIKEQAEETMDMLGIPVLALFPAHQLHGMNWTMPPFTL